MELLRRVHEAHPSVQVIVMTGEPTVDTASEAVRAGAADYLVKPVSKAAVVKSVAGAVRVKALDDDRRRLAAENRRYQDGLERLVAERTRALELSEERLNGVLSSVPDYMVMVDRDHNIVWGNEIAVRTFGELVGRKCYEGFRHESVPCAGCISRQAFADGANHDLESTVVDREGNERLLWSTASVVSRDAGGLPMLVVVTSRDVTERRRAEERGRELEAELRQAQKMEAVGQLAGGVAHDFNNLLMIIEGRVDFAMEAVPEDSDVAADLHEVQEAVKRASDLTRQLLAFSRRQVMAFERLSLDTLLANLLRMLGRLIGEDVELRFEPCRGEWRVRVDPGQIELVVMNLAVNARDAMPRGGVLSIHTYEESVRSVNGALFPDPSELPSGDFVVMEVRDNGVGMDEKVRRRVFDPFYTTKAGGGGTGLGLSTAYGILRQHQGYISVESEPGKGTVFRLYVPRTGDDTEDTSLAVHTGKIPGGTETVLLVEDDAVLRGVLSRMLGDLGYTVLPAADPEEAMRLARERGPDLDAVLSDVVLPGMNGRELTERLRREQPGLRLVLMSGYAADRLERHGIDGSEPAFLRKPFTKAQIARLLRQVLD
jgi:PAS domain S-box-containing protein